MFLKFAADRTGTAAIQYAIVTGLIAITVTASLVYLGPTIRSEFQKVADALGETREKLGLAPRADEAVITGSVTKKRQ